MNDPKYTFSNRFYTLLVIFTVGTILTMGVDVYTDIKDSTGDYPREIVVEGEGSAFIVPDIAKVRVGVNTEGPKSEIVVEENTKKVNAIIAAIEAGGVDTEDIQTTNYYLNPTYDWTEDKGSFQDGFVLDQSLEVTIRDLEKIGDIMGAVTKAGANTIGGVEFVIENKDDALSEAREEAINNATAKAEQIAEQSGLKLGKVLNFYEYNNAPYGFDGAKRDYYYETADTMALEIAPIIEPGQEEVSLTVSLTYRVK